MRQAIHLHRVLRLCMHGAIPPFPTSSQCGIKNNAISYLYLIFINWSQTSSEISKLLNQYVISYPDHVSKEAILRVRWPTWRYNLVATESVFGTLYRKLLYFLHVIGSYWNSSFLIGLYSTFTRAGTENLNGCRPLLGNSDWNRDTSRPAPAHSITTSVIFFRIISKRKRMGGGSPFRFCAPILPNTLTDFVVLVMSKRARHLPLCARTRTMFCQ
jgi:hypothetical protein